MTVGEVRFSLPTAHRVVVERRSSGGWGDPQIVFEDDGRECGTVRAIAAGSTVAATVGCDEHFAEDQAPTRSVALISTDARAWSHHDLDGEAFGTPGLSARGGHAVWVQGDDLLTWADGSFGTAPHPTGSAQVVTVDDSGTVLGIGVGISAGHCAVEAPPRRCRGRGSRGVGGRGRPAAVRGDRPVAGHAVGAPRRRVGSAGHRVRRTPGRCWWVDPRSPPPDHRAGSGCLPDDPARAIWNQVTSNTRGDLVAVGSPDRQHVTAQRYDRSRQRWTPSRVVHVAEAPTVGAASTTPGCCRAPPSGCV